MDQSDFNMTLTVIWSNRGGNLIKNSAAAEQHICL